MPASLAAADPHLGGLIMKIPIFAIFLAAVLLPSFAGAQCMPLPFSQELSTLGWVDYSGHQGKYPLSIMIVPDGSGDTLDQAYTSYGDQVDGRISVTLTDFIGLPSVGVPPSVIRLYSEGDEIVFCPEFDIARMATDTDGWTYFDGPFGGGGSNQTGFNVQVCNLILLSGTLPLWMNSPDINGDLLVDLTDVQLFAMDFYGIYNYRSDFEYDGVVNLSDVTQMAQHMGASCPGQ